jgi:hypothetical protein
MKKSLQLILILLLPVFLFSQSTSNSNPSSAEIIEKNCNGRVFTKVEQLPALNIPKEQFEDTLTAELKSRKFSLKNNGIIYKFVVTSQSQILDIMIDSGRVSKENILKETVLKFPDLWAPAIQNGRAVCAYVRLKIIFADGKLNIAILQ